ncbi:MAG: hypothetical protein MI724_08310 [Spirochaetales bacterium]|nr:hypothetical protein [Spirochaetales bacterium]
MDIKRAIAAWDGKSAAKIRGVYNVYHRKEHFIASVLDVLTAADYQNGATWLLKAWLESGNILDDDQTRAVYSSLGTLKHWEARLHVLQAIPFMSIDEESKNRVALFLRETLTDSNKFVRAWSYNGLYELAKQHGEYLHEIEERFDTAMRTESASVKARIRNIMKKGF